MLKKNLIIGLGLITMSCSSDTEALKECQSQLKAGQSAGSGDTKLTAYENSVLKDLLTSVKAGVRPFAPGKLGVCLKHSDPAKKRECETDAKLDAGELPEGEYILYSEWAVPDVGPKGTWKLKLETECTTTRKKDDGSENSSTQKSSKEYEVNYVGKERGYRLSPLRKITSPSTRGAVKCTYTITNPHGDGDKVYKGSWSVPEAPKAE